MIFDLHAHTPRLVFAVAIISVVAGCGGQKKPIGTAALNSDLQRALQAAHERAGESTRVSKPAPPAPSRAYAVHLIGADAVPHGPPSGTADAVIRLVPRHRNGYGRVCWTFTNLHAFARPTQAHLHEGRSGTDGLAAVSLGGYWKRAGCTTAANQLMSAIARSPSRYYVDIHTAKYFAGAVRGQL